MEMLLCAIFPTKEELKKMNGSDDDASDRFVKRPIKFIGTKA